MYQPGAYRRWIRGLRTARTRDWKNRVYLKGPRVSNRRRTFIGANIAEAFRFRILKSPHYRRGSLTVSLPTPGHPRRPGSRVIPKGSVRWTRFLRR